MNNKVNISAIKSKMHFIYKDEREKNIAAIVIYNKDGKFFFDPEYKNEMSNLEVEALLLRGALVDRGGKYYRPSSFNENNVSFSDAVINPEDIEVDLSAYATKEYVDGEIANIELTPGPKGDQGEQGPKGDKGDTPSLDGYVTDDELNNALAVLMARIEELEERLNSGDSTIVPITLGKILSTASEWNVLGDSISDIDITPRPKYQEILATKYSITMNSYALNGYHVYEGTPYGSIMTQVDNMSSTADVITIMGGINDYIQNIPLGTPDSMVSSNFYGAVQLLLDAIAEKSPDAKVIWLLPLDVTGMSNHGGGGANTVGATPENYREIIRFVCNRNNILCIDLSSDPDLASDKICYDHVHPTAEGHALLADKLEVAVPVVPTEGFPNEGDEEDPTPDTPDTPDTPAFEGINYKGIGLKGVYHTFTAMIFAEESMPSGTTIDISYEFINCVNLPPSSIATNTSCFEGSKNELNSYKSGEWVSCTEGITTTVNVVDGVASGTLNYTTHTTIKAGEYIRIPITLKPTAVPVTFTVTSLNVTVNGISTNIVNVGSFFDSESYEITKA